MGPEVMSGSRPDLLVFDGYTVLEVDTDYLNQSCSSIKINWKTELMMQLITLTKDHCTQQIFACLT